MIADKVPQSEVNEVRMVVHRAAKKHAEILGHVLRDSKMGAALKVLLLAYSFDDEKAEAIEDARR